MQRFSLVLFSVLAGSTLALSACVRQAGVDAVAVEASRETRSAAAVQAAHPESILPADVNGWTVETIPELAGAAPDGMQVATRLLRPVPDSRGLSPVILSAIVFDEGAGAELSLLPNTMGEDATAADVAGHTVWLVESEGDSCAALWPASDDTLVVAADGNCDTVLAAMTSFLDLRSG